MSGQYLVKFPSNSGQLFGSKGEKLNFLINGDFRVPLTYCITVDAYELFLERNGLWAELNQIIQSTNSSSAEKDNKIQSIFQQAMIPNVLADEILNESLIFNDYKKWAVRSSSNLEDMDKTSFAGLYDSYLNITGLENILDSVRKCWASLWNERAIVYREKNNLNHTQGRMAVIIQEMVDSKYAGVIFTRNPVHKKQNEMFLEYCEGLGEDLVSGKVTPYSCVIERSTQKMHHIKEPETRIFNDYDIRKLFKVALEVERCCGGPQDIEWAFDGKEYYLLQTRPITEIIPNKTNNIDNGWTRANIGEVLPSVITPLTWDIFRSTLFNNPVSFAKSSIDDSYFDSALKLINGRGYLKLKFFLDSFCYLPCVTPEIMKHVLGVNIGTQACSYKRPTGISVKLAQSLFILDIFKVFPRISLMLKKLPDIPSRETDNLEKLIKWNAQCFHLHIKCTAYSIGAFALLSHYLYKWFPSEAEGQLSLILTGNENLQTADQGVSLWEMSDFIRKKHGLQDIFKKEFEWTELVKELGKVEGGTQFLDMLQDFLHKNGARAAEEFELAVPRWKEDSSFVINIIRKYLDIPNSDSYAKVISVRRNQRDKTIYNIKSSLTKTQGIIFNKLLASYAEFCTLRENIKYRLMEGYFIIRVILLDIGTQLASKGIIKDKNDIFFLRIFEVMNIINGSQPSIEINELITNRKVQHSKWEKEYSPEIIFQDGTQLLTMESDNNLLTGIGCSPGIVEGYARVLNDISEMKSLQPGEILVTPHTDPGWTPLFLSCKGIVTEIGGFLSHGATVAREYGIPAVVGVNNALEYIHTGDFISVNGIDGQVIICDDKGRIG